MTRPPACRAHASWRRGKKERSRWSCRRSSRPPGCARANGLASRPPVRGALAPPSPRATGPLEEAATRTVRLPFSAHLRPRRVDEAKCFTALCHRHVVVDVGVRAIASGLLPCRLALRHVLNRGELVDGRHAEPCNASGALQRRESQSACGVLVRTGASGRPTSHRTKAGTAFVAGFLVGRHWPDACYEAGSRGRSPASSRRVQG